MTRRNTSLAKLAAVLAVLLAVVFVASPGASATGPRDAGYTNGGPYQGFTYPATYTGDCDGYLYHRFSYEVYRIASDTVTLEFYPEGGTFGTMWMWANGDTHKYGFQVVSPIPQGYVAYYHVQSIAKHRWWFEWHDEGASIWCQRLTTNAP